MASLFDRAPPPGHLEDWTRHLEVAPPEAPEAWLAVLVFRLGREWWALELPHCLEVLAPGRSHSLPHPRPDVLLGVAGVRGRLDLLVSLGPLLGGSAAERPEHWVVFGTGLATRFVTPVDRVEGTLALDPGTLQAPPPGAAHLAGIWREADRSIALLSLDSLLAELTEVVGR